MNRVRAVLLGSISLLGLGSPEGEYTRSRPAGNIGDGMWTSIARPFDVLAYAVRLEELIQPLACGG